MSVCNGTFELRSVGRFAAFEPPALSLDAEKRAPDGRMTAYFDIFVVLALYTDKPSQFRVFVLVVAHNLWGKVLVGPDL